MTVAIRALIRDAVTHSQRIGILGFAITAASQVALQKRSFLSVVDDRVSCLDDSSA